MLAREADVTVYEQRLWPLTIETGNKKMEQIFLNDLDFESMD